jgi:hypothetical protein
MYIADNSIDRIGIHEPLQDSRQKHRKVTAHQTKLDSMFAVCTKPESAGSGLSLRDISLCVYQRGAFVLFTGVQYLIASSQSCDPSF